MNNNGTSSVAGGSSTTQNNTAKKTKKSSKKLLIVIIVALVLIVGVVVAVVVTDPFHIFNSGNEQVEGSDNPTSSNTYDVTEDEKATTKKVLEENAEVTIGEIERVNDEYGANEALKVTVKNIGKEKANIAVDIVAKDNDDKVLDEASLYAEGIEPEQTQAFHVFELSGLTGDQLKNAKFEVHKAFTYDAPEQSGDNAEKSAEESEKNE